MALYASACVPAHMDRCCKQKYTGKHVPPPLGMWIHAWIITAVLCKSSPLGKDSVYGALVQLLHMWLALGCLGVCQRRLLSAMSGSESISIPQHIVAFFHYACRGGCCLWLVMIKYA